MSKSVIEKLNIVLEKIQQRVVKNVEDDTVSMSFFIENHQDHQAVLYFRDLFASRHAEPSQDERICRDKAIEMLDRMIEHHSLRYKSRFSVSDHLAAVETLKAMRDHLDRCYEIRSCD